MKVLYITLENLSLHKGSVVHVKEVVYGLRKLGHHVGLIANASHGDEEATLFYNLSVTPSFLLRLFRMKKQPHLVSFFILFVFILRLLGSYDIIYARDYHTVVAALLPKLLFKKKLVFEINGIANEEQKLKSGSFLNWLVVFVIKTAENVAVRCSDGIVSVTPQIVSYLMSNFCDSLKKVEVIGNGVDIDKFHPIHDEALLGEQKRKPGIAKEDAVIAFVGNLARWQGVSILVDSAIGLLSEGKKLKLLVVGDGALKAEVMRRAVQSEFQKEIIFTGMMEYEDINLFINLSDICVAPFILRRNSVTGVSPIKVFEYMACGKPVVASRVEGLEFIEEEGIGKLVEPEDAVALGRTLDELIQQREKRMEMGARGIQVVHERFRWDLKVGMIQQVLEELA